MARRGTAASRCPPCEERSTAGQEHPPGSSRSSASPRRGTDRNDLAGWKRVSTAPPPASRTAPGVSSPSDRTAPPAAGPGLTALQRTAGRDRPVPPNFRSPRIRTSPSPGAAFPALPRRPSPGHSRTPSCPLAKFARRAVPQTGGVRSAARRC
ncbi:hypothetical protein AAES_72259 [Amazona aestiva]|uniref:Uncharacterized protein n=1 Tax=Amazona aestiva TaxID=12930 RepID=A0A0Q3MIF7_AMAAE|nr:hypothetical protein AAES_72259 [Amazona aestiva]